MAEYENPEFDKDDYDKEAETSFTDEEQFQRIFDTQYKALDTFTGSDRDEQEKTLLKMLVKRFYERNQETVIYDIDDINYFIKKDNIGRPLFGVEGVRDMDKDYMLSYYKTKNLDATLEFYSFDTLQKKYGIDFIREDLGVENFQSAALRIREGRENFAQLLQTRNQITETGEHIPLQDISSQQGVNELLQTTNEAETTVKTLETSLTEVGTQTNIDKREMDGIVQAMTTVKEELTNQIYNLDNVEEDIKVQKDKLAYQKTQLEKEQDENEKELISKRISEINDEIANLELKRSGVLEVVNVNRDKLRSQVNRIKDTINKVLKEDTTLGERIRTLFREQGITIVSILTAFGMIIGVIVEAVIPTTVGGTTPKPPPKDGSGAKDWIKKQLSNLGKLLSTLAGKAAAALPGIIGSIVSWLLSATSKVVNWFGEHLWALLVLVAGLLYTAAREFIRKKRT